MSRTLAVQAMSWRLYHVSLDKSKLQECAYVLMKLFLFPNTNEESFFNFTRTSEEISLIVTENTLKLFPPNTITVGSVPWRALSILFGAYGYTHQSTGLVSKFSQALKNAGISMFYLGTAHTDFLLVPENSLNDAIKSLKETFRVLPGSLHIAPSTININDLPQNIDKEHDVVNVPIQQHKLECTIMNEELRICSMHKESRSQCAQPLLKLLFFSDDTFFSFTETEDEISLILEGSLLESFTDDVLTVSDGWRPLQRYKKKGFGEVGVINALSKPISQAQVPLIYLSTYKSAYIFVQSKHLTVAKLCLENAGTLVKTIKERKEQLEKEQQETNTTKEAETAIKENKNGEINGEAHENKT